MIDQRIVEMRAEGRLYREIQAELGVGTATVASVLRSHDMIRRRLGSRGLAYAARRRGEQAERDARIEVMRRQGLTVREIARRLEVNPSTVMAGIHRRNLLEPPPRTEEWRRRAAELRARGWSWSSIGVEIGCSGAYARKLVAGDPLRAANKLRRALALRRRGLTFAAIGDRLGVSPSTAHRWVRGVHRPRPTPRGFLL